MIVSITQDGLCWVVKYRLYDGSVISLDYKAKPSRWQVEADVGRMYKIARED